MKKENYCVYEWTHLQANKKYVGYTNNLNRRFRKHLAGNSNCKYFNAYFNNHSELISWTIEILIEGLSAHDALIIESLRTHYLEENGYRLGIELLNLKHGGYGSEGHTFKYTDKQKLNKSIAVKKLYDDPVYRQNQINGAIEAANTPEAKTKRSILSKEVWSRPSTRVKHSASLKKL